MYGPAPSPSALRIREMVYERFASSTKVSGQNQLHQFLFFQQSPVTLNQRKQKVECLGRERHSFAVSRQLTLGATTGSRSTTSRASARPSPPPHPGSRTRSRFRPARSRTAVVLLAREGRRPSDESDWSERPAASTSASRSSGSVTTAPVWCAVRWPSTRPTATSR